MTDHGLEALRADLARHTGPARTQPLVALGQALAEQYWRAGPGTPAAGPYLDEAIEMLNEAYGYLEPGEYVRGQAASYLGWLLGARHIAHGGPESDRETGIRLLDEALTFPQLSLILQEIARLVLGQLLLSRALRHMQSGDFVMRAMQSGPPSQAVADIDRAAEHTRQVVDGSVTNAQTAAAARAMLSVTESMQTVISGLGGGLGGMDLGRLMEAVTIMQKLQHQAATQPSGAGFGFVPNPFDFDGTTMTDPLERPVAVVDGAPPAEAPPPVPQAPAVPRVPAATLRADMLGRLSGPGFAAILALLGEGARPLDVDTVDELVALGSLLVEAPDAVSTDHLLLAVALHLRGVVDGGGWGGDDGADDVRAAGDSLLSSAEALVTGPADAVAVAFRLATLLDERQPALGLRARIGERFTTVTEALRTVGAEGLLYPISGEMLLLSAGTGRFGYATPGSWLPARILVAGDGPVPDEPTVSYVGSGAQVVELANRTRRSLTEAAVFVANPRRDREHATIDALLLRRTFYPRSAGLGETAENVDGAGTADEVRARLDASMLHLGCGVTADGGLELADTTVLDAAEIAAGEPAEAAGLVMLPPTTTGAAALTEALLASRFVGVIGFRDPVPERVASLMYFLLHAHLVDEGRDPASAVQAVRRWMADPHRKPPEYLPTWYEAMAVASDLADPAYWGALIHHGV